MTIALLVAIALAYVGAGGAWWTAGLAVSAIALQFAAPLSLPVAGALIVIIGCAGAVLSIPALRRALLSDRVLAVFRRIMPSMSRTEAEALHAGTVWWDGDLFTGKPDWARLLAFPKPALNAEEQAFLDNETAQLCAMVGEWETTHHNYDMPPGAWQFIKDKGFLGLIIPKAYGGRGFSAYAHSQVIQKLATRSSASTVSVMVPNSLGPAELLLHYGTEAQKRHYLPRLARGLDIPCFALTNPHAGSDAASIPDISIVCRSLWEGREVIGMRVSWEKRYITLAPVATLLGLAFRLQDPEHLLGSQHEVARLLIAPSATRDRLTAGMYVPDGISDIVGTLEAALAATIDAEAAEGRLRAAIKEKRISGATGDALHGAALAAGVLTREDVATLERAARLREAVIRVDDFAPDFGLSEAAQPVVQRAAARLSHA
jgi:acyl-CoA dehydrogenase